MLRPIAFPVISGISAASIGALIMMAMNTLYPQTWCGDGFLNQYANCSYPWSLPHGGIAALIAWRMRAGVYPDVGKLSGIRRYQIWGSLRDGAIFVVLMVSLMAFAVVPMLDNLRGKVTVSGVPADPKVWSAMLDPLQKSNIGVRMRVMSRDGKRLKSFSDGLDQLERTLEDLRGTIDGPTIFAFTVRKNDLVRTKGILDTVAERFDPARPGAGGEGMKMAVTERGVFEGRMTGLLMRIGLMSALVGFFVPTWYRAQRARRTVDRRVDLRRRALFDAQIKANAGFEVIQP